MSYGVETVVVHKKLRLDKREGSENWYAQLTLENGKRIVKSTKTDDLDEATEGGLSFIMTRKRESKTSSPPTPVNLST